MDSVQESLAKDNLINGTFPQVTEDIKIASGEGVVQRGAVLGLITVDVPTVGVADGGNVGDGVLNAVLGRKLTTKGVYTLVCTAEAANAGTFSVTAPDGTVLPDATVGVVYDNSYIKFLINDGAEDFDEDDEFTITVVVGSFECNVVDKTATDGSQVAKFINLKKVDATSAMKVSIGGASGKYNENSLTFGGTTTIDDVREDLRQVGIYTAISSSND